MNAQAKTKNETQTNTFCWNKTFG